MLKEKKTNKQTKKLFLVGLEKARSDAMDQRSAVQKSTCTHNSQAQEQILCQSRAVSLARLESEFPLDNK